MSIRCFGFVGECDAWLDLRGGGRHEQSFCPGLFPCFPRCGCGVAESGCCVVAVADTPMLLFAQDVHTATVVEVLQSIRASEMSPILSRIYQSEGGPEVLDTLMKYLYVLVLFR